MNVVLNPGQVGGANLVVSQVYQPSKSQLYTWWPGGTQPLVWCQPAVQSHIHCLRGSLVGCGPEPGHEAFASGNGNSAQFAVQGAVLRSFYPQPAEIRQRITFYPRQKQQYHGFSNYAPHSVTYNGRRYPTSEHLYQAFKARNISFMERRPDIAEAVRTVSESPNKADEYSDAHSAQEHPDWNRMRVSKMEITLWYKFSQNTELKELLLETGHAALTWGSNDDLWGVGIDGKGKNEFGKTLERVRTSFREI
ncbi:hypothetical protein B0H19DRAFT_1012743 [Mycena capillaripes]|nr:hypothetical protein B0H19DRAFT_1012743 [Mycena capillaripes]